MLTGDKVETATSIAISSGLKARRNELLFMREIKDDEALFAKMRHINKIIQRSTLIIDGTTLETILMNEEATDEFFAIAIKAPCVCVCRCSPT